MPIIKHHDNKVNIVSKAAHSKHTTGATFINLTTFSNKQDINYGASKHNRMTKCHGTLKSSEMKGLYVKEFEEELIKIQESK